MKKIICDHCKSDKVNIDAYARWDPVKNRHILYDMFLDSCYCTECKDECSIEEIEITPNEVLKLKQQNE